MPTGLKVPANPRKIVELAVNNDMNRTILVADWLRAVIQTDNAQPPMPQCHSLVVGPPNAGIVWAAVSEAVDGGPNSAQSIRGPLR